VAVIGPFLNFFISKPRLGAELIPQVVKQDKEYGCNYSGYGKTGVLDFSSPNIAKPFHAGHLRGTIIGNFIINVLKSNGWNTVGINYLGDWGKQYGVLALGYERHGSEEELKKDPIRHLFDVYVKINVFFSIFLIT
jgi:arginyl-tRNA synthetase